MIHYYLDYLRDNDDAQTDKYHSEVEVNAGDVIHVDEHFYHFVAKVTQLRDFQILHISKSAQSPDEAKLLAQQYKDWPEGLPLSS